jgi:microcystin-dependent protein
MDPMLGSIHLFPYPFTPHGYLPCDGQLLDIRENSHLFQLIGNTFGGDGTTTFAVPDYRNDAPKGSQYFIAIQGVIAGGHGR